MTRLTTAILTAFTLLTFATAAQAGHHEAGEDHSSKATEQAECNHAADEPCPHLAEGKQCPHHEGKECSHTADQPCNHDHGHEKGGEA